MDALDLSSLSSLASHPWVYPALETVHLIGLSTLFGSLLVFELRMLGWGPRLDALSRRQCQCLGSLLLWAVVIVCGPWIAALGLRSSEWLGVRLSERDAIMAGLLSPLFLLTFFPISARVLP